jgi:predicted DNA binding CopG/RHH family protein
MVKARMFWTIECWQEESEAILTQKLKDLSEERNRLNRECPQVPRFAYLKAKRGITNGEATYEVDKKKTV